MLAPIVRPAYHFTPSANWLSDPNGLVWHDGLWHLFYQHNPHGEEWGHMSWGHATSPDLVSWRHMIPAILHDDDHAIYSGCAVIDPDDSAGLGAGAMIAAYTAASADGTRQAQHLASSVDGGISFDKYGSNPVLDLGLADFRDPNIFRHRPTGRWIMVVARSADNCADLFASTDLRQWHHLSQIGPWDAPGHLWECPMLIDLPVAGGGDRWLFKTDVLNGAPGSGALLLTGQFDGTRFTPDLHDGQPDWQCVDHGRDFYAAVPWHEPRDDVGRPCWIGWTGNHHYQGRLPLRGWRGAMSSPRRLSLEQSGGRYRLVQQVEPAVADCFATRQIVMAPGEPIDLPLAIRLALTVAPGARLALRIDQATGEGLTIDLADDMVRIDRPAGFDPLFDQPIAAPLSAGLLRLWLDGGVIELESNEGRDWLTAQHALFAERIRLTLTSDAPLTIEIGEFARPSAAGR